ncbi:MAG: cellulase family glycosylhydrolase [Oscillospiraceae bacterium]|nr:cellulase family glycosylhydrolase [Oscillospiraceae bacterium]
MKKMKRLVSAVTAAILSVSLAAGSVPAAPVTAAGSQTAIDLVDAMGMGWNLGNTFDSWGTAGYQTQADGYVDNETGWSNPATTKDMISAIKASGFDSIRIPITWYENTNSSTFDINDKYLERIKTVIDYAYDNDMYVIINMHWDWESGGSLWLNKGEAALPQFTTMWTEIANYFKSYDNHLVFEDMNEVTFDYGVLNKFNQTFVDTIRATGGNNANRLLLLAGANTDLDKTCNSSFTVPDDEMVAVSIHYYNPTSFTIATPGESWGTNTWDDTNGLAANFNKMKTTFVDKGVPVILGEYGVYDTQSNGTKDHTSTLNYLKAVASTALGTKGISAYLWDSGCGGTMQYFDRKSLSWYDSEIAAIYKELGNGAGIVSIDWVEAKCEQMKDADTGELQDRYSIDIGDSDRVKFDIALSDAQKAVNAGGGGGTISYWDNNANSGKGGWFEGAITFAYTVEEDGSITLKQYGEDGETVVNYGYIQLPEDVSTTNVQVSFYYAGYNDASDTWQSLDVASISKAYTVGLVDGTDTTEDTKPTEATEDTKPTETTEDTTPTDSTDATEATDPVSAEPTFWLHGQFAGNDFWSDEDAPSVVADGSGSYSLKWEAAGETKDGDLAIFLDSNINIYQYAINEDSTGILDGTLNITLDEVLIDGEPVELTGEPKLMTMDNGKSLRLTIINPWSAEAVSAFDANVTIAESLEVKFTAQIGLDEETETVYGDVDGNGKVELLDVILLNKNLLGMEKLTDKGSTNADVNLDKKVDGTDSLFILKSLVSLVTLPVQS